MKKVFLLALMLFIILPRAYSQDSDENLDWNEADYYLFSSLKEDLGQDEAEAYQSIGFVHIKQENWERAATYFKKAVTLNSKLYWSWYNLGLLHVCTEKGNKFFKKAISADPDYSPSYYWLAYCYCKNRKDREAITFFKKYLEVAEGVSEENERYKRAKRILIELYSGREGKELWRVRKINW